MTEILKDFFWGLSIVFTTPDGLRKISCGFDRAKKLPRKIAHSDKQFPC